MWFHIELMWKDEYGDIRRKRDVNFNEEQIDVLSNRLKKGSSINFLGTKLFPHDLEGIEAWKTGGKADNSISHWTWIKRNGENVTKEFFNYIPDNPEDIEIQRINKKDQKILSKDVFIVHGHDLEPMKELKTMLLEFGLNPIVLFEQPSASKTIIEKLEKYSDVGYAFVILTPDDIGCKNEIFDAYSNELRTEHEKTVGNFTIGSKVGEFKKEIMPRARENVLLEFGFFIGVLGRNRVCPLLKGDLKEPSDIHGIVYVHFNNSVNEKRDMIIKELYDVGYELNI